jgi:hypothetical protein
VIEGTGAFNIAYGRWLFFLIRNTKDKNATKMR